MALYVTLYQFTEPGIKNIKGSPDRAKAAIKAAEAVGGKMLGFYYTLGGYDMVAVTEWADEKAATAFALSIASAGNVRSTTMKAFTVDEFAEIVKKMP